MLTKNSYSKRPFAFRRRGLLKMKKCFIVFGATFLFEWIVWKRIVDIVREIFVRIRIY